MLFLLAILAVGWPIVLMNMRGRQPRPDPLAPARAAEVPPLPPPDTSLPFRGIVDKRPLNPRENPAYAELLQRVRAATPETLEKVARRDVVFSQLFDNPARYRGLPIHVEGTALRVLAQEVTDSKIFPKGKYYEAYIVTPDSQNFPWVLVFEDAPADLTVGDRLWQRVEFNGYFFKWMPYQSGKAGQVFLNSPILVGRFPRAPISAPVAVAPKPVLRPDVHWSTYVLIGLSLYFALRMVTTLRRSYARRSGILPTLHLPASPPTESIEPEALARFLQRGPEREEAWGDDEGEDDEDEEYR